MLGSKQDVAALSLKRTDVGRTYDPEEHYRSGRTGPVDEFGDAPETPASIKNIGWTLGNDCPYRCKHCYSMSARRRGANMSRSIVDRVVGQLALNGVETVNLGGNEPLFTNGPKLADTMMPYIIQELHSANIEVGLTTSGISLVYLYHHFREAFDLLNDVDVSFDSPIPEEHNRNRGAKLFDQAVEALEICQSERKPHSCIMAGMNWNFTPSRLRALVALARKYQANIRINPVKPVEPAHMNIALPPEQYYLGFETLMSLCDSIDLGEPPLGAVTGFESAARCPCGRTSFRIHSITPDGAIYVSPCVYLHDYKSTSNLLTTDLYEIIHSPEFIVFRQRNKNPHLINGCADCSLLQSCGGGCAARSYLHHVHSTGVKSMTSQDPYCPRDQALGYSFPSIPNVVTSQRLVHMDYLCTWIGSPKEDVDVEL